MYEIFTNVTLVLRESETYECYKIKIRVRIYYTS